MSHTAGTAGEGYRTAPLEHPYRERPADYGERPVCHCGRTRDQHRRTA